MIRGMELDLEREDPTDSRPTGRKVTRSLWTRNFRVGRPGWQWEFAEALGESPHGDFRLVSRQPRVVSLVDSG